MDWDMTGDVFLQLLPPSWRGWMPPKRGKGGEAKGEGGGELREVIQARGGGYDCVGGEFDFFVTQDSATAGEGSGAGRVVPYGHFLLYAHVPTLLDFFEKGSVSCKQS
jgi:hypothetical protein